MIAKIPRTTAASSIPHWPIVGIITVGARHSAGVGSMTLFSHWLSTHRSSVSQTLSSQSASSMQQPGILPLVQKFISLSIHSSSVHILASSQSPSTLHPGDISATWQSEGAEFGCLDGKLHIAISTAPVAKSCQAPEFRSTFRVTNFHIFV